MCLHRFAKCEFIQIIDDNVRRHSLGKVASVVKTCSHGRELAQLPVGIFQRHKIVLSHYVNQETCCEEVARVELCMCSTVAQSGDCEWMFCNLLQGLHRCWFWSAL